jgi:cell wall-associated NlpC family hydrolase
MQPGLAKSITAMKAANPNIQITSGYRSSQQQATLYALKGGQGVAPPGQSNHQTGTAADLGPPSQFGWIAKNASKFGLNRPAPSSEPWHVESMGDPATGSMAVSVAQSFLGTPYVWGGGNAGGASTGQPGDSADPNAPNQVGFDCSGLMVAIFAKLGISLPRTSQQQAKVGTPVSSLAQAQAGDLILYNEPGEGANSHVAMYIGGGQQIAAPYTGQVVQKQAVDKAHLSTIRRVLSGGSGQALATAAQSFIGAPSTDASNHAVGSNIGLQNTFIDQVNTGGAALAGTAASGGGFAGVSTGSSSASSTSGATGSTAR